MTLIHEWDLDEPFENLRQKNKKLFFEEQLAKLELTIDGIKHELNVFNIDTKDLKEEQKESLQQLPRGRDLLEHIKNYEYIQEQLEVIKTQEKLKLK